jgi:hypothetical protein
MLTYADVSGTDVLTPSQTEDSSELSDSGAGFLGGIGDFDKFLNSVQDHVSPSSANDIGLACSPYLLLTQHLIYVLRQL